MLMRRSGRTRRSGRNRRRVTLNGGNNVEEEGKTKSEFVVKVTK
jgi:hypothetical protein